MPRRSIICAAAVMTLPAFLLAQTPVLPQIEQSRQFIGPPGTIDLQGQRNAPQTGLFEGAKTPDDAFGAQVIFKRKEKPQPFNALGNGSKSGTFGGKGATTQGFAGRLSKRANHPPRDGSGNRARPRHRLCYRKRDVSTRFGSACSVPALPGSALRPSRPVAD